MAWCSRKSPISTIISEHQELSPWWWIGPATHCWWFSIIHICWFTKKVSRGLLCMQKSWTRSKATGFRSSGLCYPRVQTNLYIGWINEKLESLEEVFKEEIEDPKLQKFSRKRKPYYDLVVEFINRRNDLGLTQEELAEKADTFQSRISNIESGDHDFRISTLINLAEALDSELIIRLLPFEAKQKSEERTEVQFHYEEVFMQSDDYDPLSYGYRGLASKAERKGGAFLSGGVPISPNFSRTIMRVEGVTGSGSSVIVRRSEQADIKSERV